MKPVHSYQFPFAKYPAVRLAVLFAAGIAAGELLHLASGAAEFLVLLAVIGFFAFEGAYKYTGKLVCYYGSVGFYLLLVPFFGMYWVLSHEGQHHIEKEFVRTSAWKQELFSGQIYGAGSSSSGKLHLDVAIDSTLLQDSLMWHHSYNIRAIADIKKLGLSDPDTLKPGTRITFKATIYPSGDQRNPYDFDYARYLRSKDIFLQAGIDSVYEVDDKAPVNFWDSFRNDVLGLVEINFSDSTRPLAKALLLGHKKELDREDRIAFARAGLSHIMAVSGLHVGFIIAPFWLIIPYFWTIKYGKEAGLILLILLLTGYAGLTGFSASVSRAALTGGFITFGKLYHKIRDSKNLTAAAALILLLNDPMELFQVGFQLSFAAVYIILLTAPVINSFLPPWIRFRWYGQPIMVIIISIAVQVGLYPILVFYFGEFSLIGPLANAAVIPFLGAVIPFSLALLPVADLFPTVAALVNMPNALFFEALKKLVAFLNQIDGSWISATVGSAWLFPIWVAVIFTIASIRIPKMRWKMVILLLLLLSFQSLEKLAGRLESGKLKITFFDVGQGDAILVETPGGKNILVDTGRWTPTYNSGRFIIIPHLKASGIRSIDAVFLSHPHSDHIGGILELMKQIPIKCIYDSGYRYDSELYKSYLRLAKEKNIPVNISTAGQIISPDSATRILIYGPGPGNHSSDPNEHSIVMELIYGNTELLFTGDAGTEQERRIIDKYGKMLDTDILKAGHHGSRTSSSPEFLELASPSISVVSLAKRNKFGHPHPEAIQTLRKKSGRIYYTSLSGALQFISDGSNFEYVEWK